jgi:hypothetical protein
MVISYIASGYQTHKYQYFCSSHFKTLEPEGLAAPCSYHTTHDLVRLLVKMDTLQSPEHLAQ